MCPGESPQETVKPMGAGPSQCPRREHVPSFFFLFSPSLKGFRKRQRRGLASSLYKQCLWVKGYEEQGIRPGLNGEREQIPFARIHRSLIPNWIQKKWEGKQTTSSTHSRSPPRAVREKRHQDTTLLIVVKRARWRPGSPQQFKRVRKPKYIVQEFS